ncbi:ERF family protein, partial [Salmonella enterica]
MNALQKIQTELKAPKSLYNSFGKYNYRSAETILEAVKP